MELHRSGLKKPIENIESTLPMNALAAKTPYYLLMHEDHPIGPKVVQPGSENECSPVFGFSDKVSYDKFCMSSEEGLKPYPLVKIYLRNQVGAPGDGLKLVVVNADGPSDPCLYAATMEAVLEAQENRTSHVSAMYRLVADQEVRGYRIEEISAQL